MTITHLLIFGFATWRIANLLVSEGGPFQMFRHIRELSGITHDKEGIPFQIPNRFFAQLLSCVWCASIWVSLAWTVFWLLSPETALKFAVIFAFSSVAIMIDKYVKG